MSRIVVVVVCLQLAVGAVGAVGLCSVPFMSAPFGDCSASSYMSEDSFNYSIDLLTCALFGNLNFTNSTLDSWLDITDACIQESPDTAMLLYHASGPGRPITAALCQIYEQSRMNCLLAFDLLIPHREKFGYIYLSAINSNKTMFTASIGSIFNNRNNIQPMFTSKLSAETIDLMKVVTVSKTGSSVILLSVSSSFSSIIATTTSLISLTTTTANILTTTQPLSWSTLSTVSTITQYHSSSSLHSSTIPAIYGDITVALSTTIIAFVVLIIALVIAVTLAVVLIKYKTQIKKNSPKRSSEVIFTCPNPVYGYLQDDRGESKVPETIYEKLETLTVCTEPEYDTVPTV